jgi:O-antigen/teichoic acid export membrane protein
MSAPKTGRAKSRIEPLIRRISGSSDGGPSSLSDLRDSETAKAVGLAAAMIANNIIALGSSIVFARLINDYGSLAALVSYLLILTVFGQAMQVATAREGVLGHLGTGQQLLATLRRWMVTLAFVTAAVTVISILARQPIADLVGVKGDSWAAAAGLPAGCMYLALSILRGGLQGIGDYKGVGLSLIGEQGSRLVLGAALAIVGLGVTGAYLGSLLSYVVMSLYCWGRLYAQLGGTALVPGSPTSPAPVSLRRHVWGAWVAIAGLAVIQLLQNIDLITAKHQFDKNTASAYAVTAVAAKVLIWVAMGAGFYLVPEASRRRAAGEDERPVLFGALAIVAVCAIPCLLIYAFAAHPLLSIVFGPKRAIASDALLPLGAAFAVLATTYLAVQYMLAMKRKGFLIAIGLVAVLEPILLLQAAKRPGPFAAVVLLVQVIGAVLAFALALRRRKARPEPPSAPREAAEPEPVPVGSLEA